jgi:FMN phosphatase YigB (HAD superfamily)
MIKFVYFDVGGVALLDFSGTQKWSELKKSIGITPEKDRDFESLWDAHCARVCIDYDVDSFLPILTRKLGISFPSHYSLLNEFVSRFEANNSLWPIIKDVSSKYQVGLLTNMYPRMLPILQQKNLLPPISWNAVVDSSEVGYQKPQKEIYEIAQQKAHVAPQEILFVENTRSHIEGANAMNWHTFLYDPTQIEKSNEALKARL